MEHAGETVGLDGYVYRVGLRVNLLVVSRERRNGKDNGHYVIKFSLRFVSGLLYYRGLLLRFQPISQLVEQVGQGCWCAGGLEWWNGRDS